MLLKKLRNRQPEKRKITKYLLYALGEIILVVAGILIALQINNWNEIRKERQSEKNILAGIRDNIQQDTIDFNANITFYQKRIKKDSIVLDHLIHQKEYTEEIINELYLMSILDVSVAFQYSHFEEAKQRGLSIISNEKLRDNLRKIYEFYYPQLQIQENEMESLDYYHVLNKELSNYFEVDSISLSNLSKNKVKINEENYNQILNNKKLHFKIYDTIGIKKAILKRHIKIRRKILEMLKEINLELE